MSSHLYEYRRVDILELARNQLRADGRAVPPKFVPGVTPVPVSGKVYDADELVAAVEAVLDGHWTDGPVTDEFERQLARTCGVRCAAFCNSGSSANLLALATAKEEGKWKDGDEIVTCAVGFPTTVAPIIQLGLKPVFVDAALPGYGPNTEQVVVALNRPRAKGVILAHTLGNPFDCITIGKACEERGATLIEDCCDALGSTYAGKPVGTFGQFATLSFYPAHHICTVEGGAVLTNSPRLDAVVRSYRDWGRDCYCATGKDDTCGKRFKWQLGSLPAGYDHKHIFSRMGWNLKNNDIGAAIGLAQLRKLSVFAAARRSNFSLLRSALAGLDDVVLPDSLPNADACWFGFPLTIKNRRDMISLLGERKIGTRPIFAGNICRQPAMDMVQYEVVGDLLVADRVMRDSFYVGIYPGVSEEQVRFTASCIREVVS